MCVPEDNRCMRTVTLLELFPLKLSESLLRTGTELSKEERKKLNIGQWLKKCFLPYPGVNTGCKKRK